MAPLVSSLMVLGLVYGALAMPQRTCLRDAPVLSPAVELFSAETAQSLGIEAGSVITFVDREGIHPQAIWCVRFFDLLHMPLPQPLGILWI